MDITDREDDEQDELDYQPQPRALPSDLPKSLDDRRHDTFKPDIEIYDDWSGTSSKHRHEFLRY